MRIRLISSAFFSFALLTAAITPQASGQSSDHPCDRACLDGLVEQYLDALIAKNPSQLPLAPDIKYTENGQQMEIGDGMWHTKCERGDYSLHFADPASGNAGFLGVIKENGSPQILGLRMKVENGSITEIEKLISRYNPNDFGDPSGLYDRPAFTEPLPPEKRLSREKLIAVADSYFEAIEKNTPDIIPFHPDARRVENGIGTANNPNGTEPHHKMTPRAQFDTGFSYAVTEIRERRFLLVDEERGLVFAHAFFDHEGSMAGMPYPYNAPFTWMIVELFEVEDGGIREIEAILVPVPYRMDSGW